MSFSFSFDLGPSEARPGPVEPSNPSSTASSAGSGGHHPFRVVPYSRPREEGPRREVVVGGAGNSMWVTTQTNTVMSIPEGVDLLPGVYEGVCASDDMVYTTLHDMYQNGERSTSLNYTSSGGLKLWESSVDLVRYMREAAAVKLGPGVRVLELGCGHGLPGIYALQQGASVSFSDLNAEVLEGVTRVNIALNLGPGEDEGRRICLLSGDWVNVSNALLQSPEGEGGGGGALFDLILAAETTYTEASSQKVVDMMARHLRPHTGLGLIAGKRYYFGTGGSMADVRDRCMQCLGGHDGGGAPPPHVEVVSTYDDGMSNIREILAIRQGGGSSSNEGT